MPEQSRKLDEAQKNGQQQDLTKSHDAGNDNDASRDARRPMQAQEVEHGAQQDAAELRERWPELSQEAEKLLKQDFERIADKAAELREAIDEFLAKNPEVDMDRADDVRCHVDQKLGEARREVLDAREAARNDQGDPSNDVHQRMTNTYDELAQAEARLAQELREVVGARNRQEILEQSSDAGTDMKKTLAEMNGRELEQSELQAFRRDAGLPDEGLVVRKEEGELFSANISMKKLIDNLEQFAEVQRADQEQQQAQPQSQRRASTDEQWERMQRADEAALEQPWDELKPAAEQRLKEAFRDVSEQADRTRDAIEQAAQQTGQTPRIEQLRGQLEDEMCLARRDVIEARDQAREQDGKLPREISETLEAREKRLAAMDRELEKINGEKVSDYLRPSGLTESLERYRAILADDVDWQKAEADRAQANGEVNSSDNTTARDDVRAAERRLEEMDELLRRRVMEMRPDLVEVRLREQNGEDRMRIDMTDFTHRVGDIAHTAKAHVYKEAMERAFPDAEVSMLEYRSQAMHELIGEQEEFRDKIERELKRREEEIEIRRREFLY